ncbi:MAG: 16S rRNA (adenine(1518)-N(6)/adenine(1519)-N(6))-dimethyltransferase RsmA [Treponemataceae bacterium]|nr:16S rRNA (adenine(1518)-N(6)/adenine(1519)-N(6))-dimethyltransferase RsmA [Spirochaetales bacterium]MDY6031557.1 16S rRNA (adenine(1518)-N(6)/adenine(1519)-N(6))-dimethyltransferase RsmA [Treponemataceae bacterium]
MLPNYDSPTDLKAILDSRGMAMQKKFGQNFLINSSARQKLAESLDLSENDSVWEVGPGLGSLTTEILKRGAKLTAFEIDRGFVNFLTEEIMSEFPNQLKIVSGDFLKTWKNELDTNGQAKKFFGNLPYNVAATIMADLISSQIRFEKCVITVQKEVAQRICAKNDSEDYSSFSVLCQWAYDVKPLMDLGSSSFWPKPNVNSRAVIMTKKDDFPNCENPVLFLKMLRAVFANRRKTIKNNLNNLTQNPQITDKILLDAGIESSIRAETLDVKTLLHLSDCINKEGVK